MEKRIKWHLENRRVSELKPYDKNPRIISEAGLDQLKDSFDEIGFAQPININTSRKGINFFINSPIFIFTIYNNSTSR